MWPPNRFVKVLVAGKKVTSHHEKLFLSTFINEKRKQKKNPSVNDSDVRRDGKERVEIRSKGRQST